MISVGDQRQEGAHCTGTALCSTPHPIPASGAMGTSLPLLTPELVLNMFLVPEEMMRSQSLRGSGNRN